MTIQRLTFGPVYTPAWGMVTDCLHMSSLYLITYPDMHKCFLESEILYLLNHL